MSNNSDSSCDDFVSMSSNDSDESFHSATSVPLRETIMGNFSFVNKCFKAVHINAQSIPAHYADLLTTFDRVNVDAICVSETWLKPCLPSTCYGLPGFKLIRNDRIGRSGGGVAIYLRSDLPYTIISASAQPPPTDALEFLLLEVQVSRYSKMLLGVYYSPSMHNDYFQSFESTLEVFLPNYSNSILMGDFNTCLLKGDSRSRKLTSILDAYNMKVLPLDPTHCSPGCRPSLLDLIIVSSPNLVAKHGQSSAEIFSYHDLVYVAYNVRPPKAKVKTLMLRNFSAMNVESLREDASNIDWSDLIKSKSIDEKVAEFNVKIKSLYDKHAPVKPVKIKHLPAPWLSDELKAMISAKHAAKAKFKKNKTEECRNKYI